MELCFHKSTARRSRGCNKRAATTFQQAIPFRKWTDRVKQSWFERINVRTDHLAGSLNGKERLKRGVASLFKIGRVYFSALVSSKYLEFIYLHNWNFICFITVLFSKYFYWVYKLLVLIWLLKLIYFLISFYWSKNYIFQVSW